MKILLMSLGVMVAIGFTGGSVRAQDYLADVHAEPRPTPPPKKKVPVKQVKKAPRVVPHATPAPTPKLKLKPVYRPAPQSPTLAPPISSLGTNEDEAFRRKDLRKGETGEFGLDTGIHYFEGLGDNPNPGFLISPTLIYQMTKNTSFSAEIEYRSIFDAWPLNDTSDGWKDLDLAYTYANLYTSRDKTFNLAFAIDGMFPTSIESQNDSLLMGESFTLKMTQKLGNFKLKFDNTVYGYEFMFAQASNGTDYNAPFAFMNKVGVSWEWFKDFKWNNSFGYFTIQDFGGNTHNIFNGSSGFTYDLPGITLDLSYKYKNGELNDLTMLDGSNYQLFTGVTFHF